MTLNKEKSEAYKKLVLDMQKKYPVYDTKAVVNFPMTISRKGNPNAKKVMQEFAATFQNKQDFYDTLKGMGFEWMEVNNAGIYEMRAKEALRIAIEHGFDPFDVVTKKDPSIKLFAPIFDGENICHEINMYTYWQGLGYAEKTPKIKYLLVAQDWGNLNLSQDFIDKIKKWNDGDRSPLYSAKPMGNGTDGNLFELFEILGYDLSRRCDELFFTNFCLGYRSADAKAVGGMTKELMMKDAKEFKRLCEILEPENILCLGRLTSECAYEVLTGKSFGTIYNGAKNYNDFLIDHVDITVKCGEKVARLYPLAHCGYMGSMTRRKGMPKQSDPLHYQKQDWERIAQDNGISSQNAASDTKVNIKKEPIKLSLTPEIINKEFFKDMMYLHVGPEFGAILEGYIAMLNAKGEFYSGSFLDIVSPLGGGTPNGLLEKIEESFMNFRTEMPNDKKRTKNGWTYFYLGYRHVLYVNNKVLDSFCKKMDIDVEHDLKISEKWLEAGMKTIAEYDNIENKGSYISPERMDRFTWHDEDLKILTEEEINSLLNVTNFKKQEALYGAFLGDMIGAPYEFDKGDKVKDFPLFSKESRFTDDSVMTIAVAEALLKAGDNADEDKVTSEVVKSMQKWGRKYPNAGYGGRFRGWLKEDNPQPYGSYGNGSAMRVSAVGWLYNTLEKTREVARWTAEVSHNHPEGIKGAESTASAIFLARTGKTKEEIKNYIINEFNYDLLRTLDEIRPHYHHDESCQKTVPEAIIAFLESTDFEDAIRNAVSLGGDTDTLACITGSIAEAFYNVSKELVIECRKRLPKDMLLVIDKFESAILGDEFEENSSYDESLDNERLEYAISKYHKDKTPENHQNVLRAIYYQLHEEGGFLDPLIKKTNDKDEIEWHVKTIKADNKDFDVVFTNYYEYLKGDNTSLAISETSEKFRVIVEYGGDGIAINPYGKTFLLTAEEIKNIVNAEKPQNNIKIFKGDITKLISVDAIVNATNTHLSGKYGVDKAIHEAAGHRLSEACQRLNGCKVGEAKITKGYKLSADYVIHTVGANYNDNPNANDELYQCYWNSLKLAEDYHLHVIAFPAISTGAMGFPKNKAAQIAIKAIGKWFDENADYGMTVIFVYPNSDDITMFKAILKQDFNIKSTDDIDYNDKMLLEK